MHSKSNIDQLSQTPYEDQLSDHVLLPNMPMLQNGTSTSLDDSQCSSGYSSDNSAIGLWSYPTGTCKVLPNIAEKEQGTYENFTAPHTQTISNDKLTNSPIRGPENKGVQNRPISSAKSVVLTNPFTSQKQCKEHTSSTRGTRIPKPSGGSTRMPGPAYCVPNNQPSSVTVSPSAVQEDELASENRLVF